MPRFGFAQCSTQEQDAVCHLLKLRQGQVSHRGLQSAPALHVDGVARFLPSRSELQVDSTGFRESWSPHDQAALDKTVSQTGQGPAADTEPLRKFVHGAVAVVGHYPQHSQLRHGHSPLAPSHRSIGAKQSCHLREGL
jgi:hypothetical protein